FNARTDLGEGRWTSSRVRQRLLSPIVAGLRMHDGEVVGPLMRPDGSPWPAIITRETREQVERALRSRYSVGTPRQPNRPALCSGVLVCGVCGFPMTPRRYSGARSDMYSCNSDGGQRCGRVAISLPDVDAIVTETVLQHLEDASPRLRRE